MREPKCTSSVSVRTKRHFAQPTSARSEGTVAPTVRSSSSALRLEPEVPSPEIGIDQAVDWRVKRILSLIDSEDGKIGSDMADVCRKLDLGISADYATKLFKRETGIGFREYGARKRLMKAASQLAETSLSIKVIAADLGYNIPQAFSRRFKFQYQVKPTEYRRQQHP